MHSYDIHVSATVPSFNDSFAMFDTPPSDPHCMLLSGNESCSIRNSKFHYIFFYAIAGEKSALIAVDPLSSMLSKEYIKS